MLLCSVPDGLTLASGSIDPIGGDNTVHLWDAVTGTHMQTLKGHAISVLSIAFSPDGGTLASGVSTVPSVYGMRSQATTCRLSKGIEIRSIA